MLRLLVNALARHNRRDRAQLVDRFCRWAFPAVLVVALGVAAILSLA